MDANDEGIVGEVTATSRLEDDCNDDEKKLLVLRAGRGVFLLVLAETGRGGDRKFEKEELLMEELREGEEVDGDWKEVDASL